MFSICKIFVYFQTLRRGVLWQQNLEIQSDAQLLQFSCKGRPTPTPRVCHVHRSNFAFTPCNKLQRRISHAMCDKYRLRLNACLHKILTYICFEREGVNFSSLYLFRFVLFKFDFLNSYRELNLSYINSGVVFENFNFCSHTVRPIILKLVNDMSLIFLQTLFQSLDVR